MTLQQKMLAKQSKKGFTLVELVVVIAILAILAAVAIPSVIGIINSANDSAGSSNAASLDAACKDLYAGVVGGEINATDHGALATSLLPAKGAANSAKVSTAKTLTVQNAITYSGLTTTITSDKIGDFRFSATDGTIKYYKDVAGNTDFPDSTNTVALTTSFSTLYPNA